MNSNEKKQDEINEKSKQVLIVAARFNLKFNFKNF